MTQIQAKYSKKMCDFVNFVATRGGNVRDIQSEFQIDSKTLKLWRAKYPDFDDAIKNLIKSAKKFRKQFGLVGLKNSEHQVHFALVRALMKRMHKEAEK